ncbi:MAG: hypothetical protein U5L07_03180 [Desulfobacterales bacterium]|nr:hypothetical protein [Desulfobacterales bacterium]
MTPDQYEHSLEQISAAQGDQGHTHGAGESHESQKHDAQETLKSMKTDINTEYDMNFALNQI